MNPKKKPMSKQNAQKPAAKPVAPVAAQPAEVAEVKLDHTDRYITKTYKSGLTVTTGRRVFADKGVDPVELPKTIVRNKLAEKTADDPLVEKTTDYTYFYNDGSKTVEVKVQRVNVEGEYDLVKHTVTTTK